MAQVVGQSGWAPMFEILKGDGSVYRSFDLGDEAEIGGIYKVQGTVPDISITDTDDTELYSLEAGDTLQIIADATIQSAASSPVWSDTVLAEGTKVLDPFAVDIAGVEHEAEYRPSANAALTLSLADILSEGTKTWLDAIKPAMTAQQLTDAEDDLCGGSGSGSGSGSASGSGGGGIKYAFGTHLYSGDQSTGTGMEGTLFTGGWFAPQAAGNYDTIAQLDPAAVSPWSTLLNNNAFGNKNRFTDDAGGQTYSNDLVIDHLTGLMYYRVAGTAAVHSAAVTAAEASTQGGFSDWHLCPREVMVSIADEGEGVDGLDYAPFNLNGA